ncbi:outer membrane assembly protein AsmA [Orbaceae bacterium ac157xtp]
MVKKILLTLLLLIILAIAGIVALVVFVDPNNFKGFISDTVKDKTGYELTIEGDLRWHIWPQISILTDSIRLEDEGAKKPILTADNMRLDVELLPLFSKELVVKNVLVKSAAINITEQSKGNTVTKPKPKTTVNQTQTEIQEDKAPSTWSFTLNKLDIIDSTVLLQQGKDIISFRNIDASILQKDDKNVDVKLSGNVNRNQQDLTYSLNASVNLATLPEHATLNLHNLDFNYQGIDVPAGGIKGEAKATIIYQQTPLKLNTNDLVLTINDNQINGKLNADLSQKPTFDAVLTSKKIDLTPFIANKSNTKNSEHIQTTQTKPVVTTNIENSNELAILKSFDANLNLNVEQVNLNNVLFNNVIIEAHNKNGIATLNKVNVDLAKGHIIANGKANGNQPKALIQLSTKVVDIDLNTLFSQLELAQNFKGALNANGDIAITTIKPDMIMQSLTGDLAIVVNNARLESLNIQNIVQIGVEQTMKEKISSQDYQKYTEFHELSAKAALANGDMNLSSIKASSETLNMTGKGRIGIDKKDLDIDLLVKILSGWNGKNQTIQKLRDAELPLRIYGTFDKIQYKLEADQVIKALINNKLQDQLDKLKNRLNNQTQSEQSESTEETDQKGDKQKAKELLGGFLNKLNKKE